MQRQTYDLMLDQVRSIFRAVSGSELPHDAHTGQPPPPFGFDELLLRRFAELEVCVHLLPQIAERVPSVSFVPPVEVLERENELVIQVAVPGVRKEDVSADLIEGALVISGLRQGEPTDGQIYRHAEIPRGPFRRVLPLRTESLSEPLRVEVKEGLLRVSLAKRGAPGGAVAKA
jgi:HSP20 family molecular chaperone IbpA